MTYTKKDKGGNIQITGSYIPNGFTCKCRQCTFTIEVPKCTTDEQIKELVDKITGR